jgi:LuxR family maltose regulon positive regulatory protein
MGRELFVSPSTIHSHVKSIYRKLGVSSRASALGRARDLGLI